MSIPFLYLFYFFRGGFCRVLQLPADKKMKVLGIPNRVFFAVTDLPYRIPPFFPCFLLGFRHEKDQDQDHYRGCDLRIRPSLRYHLRRDLKVALS